MKRTRPAGGPPDPGRAGTTDPLRILRTRRSGQVRRRRRGGAGLILAACLGACALLAATAYA